MGLTTGVREGLEVFSLLESWHIGQVIALFPTWDFTCNPLKV